MIKIANFLGNALALIWMLPQSIGAFILYALFHNKVRTRYYTKPTKPYFFFVRVYEGDWSWGVSLGFWIFLPYASARISVKHEQGHSLQSLILGPLYLIVVGLPSVAMNLISRVSIRFSKNYYGRWPESWADKLGGVERK